MWGGGGVEQLTLRNVVSLALNLFSKILEISVMAA